MAPVLKTGGGDEPSVGSNPTAAAILENGGIGRHTVLWSGEGSAAFFVGSSPTSPAKIILVLNVD